MSLFQGEDVGSIPAGATKLVKGTGGKEYTIPAVPLTRLLATPTKTEHALSELQGINIIHE